MGCGLGGGGYIPGQEKPRGDWASVPFPQPFLGITNRTSPWLNGGDGGGEETACRSGDI